MAFSLVGLTLSIVSVTSSAQSDAASANPSPAPPAALAAASANDAEKRLGLGVDAQLLLPIGAFAETTGAQVGPLVRLGCRLIGDLELTIRLGFLFAFEREVPYVGGLSFAQGFNVRPVWLGARYFFMDRRAGLYGAAEVGINFMVPTAATGSLANDLQARLGFNVGVGYVISENVPIDIRAQLTMINLLPRDTQEVGGVAIAEAPYFAVGLSAGYTLRL